ncbi:MAG: RNA polymerase sigma factor [Bacteroidales bacterium]|nr:RNA polymerase sigma factor [Candidatus Latescibacterota bacterium]
MDFKTLYTDYSADVFRFAFWLSGKKDEAEDITSDTFVRAWARNGKIHTDTLMAYLFAIARNLHLENIRKGKYLTELEDTHIDSSPGPDIVTESRMELQRVLRVIGTLPEKERTAFIMRVGHELSYDEISRVLGISLSSAKVKVHRARKKLIVDRLKKEEKGS